MSASDPSPSVRQAKSRGLWRSGLIVSSMTMISRVLGFIRDQVFAIVFGAGAMTDAFFLAFSIPNFLRRLFGEGAFAQAFVPVFSEYKSTRSEDELRDLAAHVSGTLATVVFGVAIAAVLAAPLLVMVIAPGFHDDPVRYAATADMLRITFPYIFFISLVAYAGGILNSLGYFAVPAITPVLLNVCLIGSALLLSPLLEQPVYGLAWGVFLAGLVQLLFQLPFLRRVHMLPRPRWGWRHSGVKRVLALMIPAIIGSSVAQINLLLDKLIASFLPTGSFSWLYYSDRLVEFPLGVLGIALATVVLPKLSSQHATTERQGFSNTLDWALRVGWVIGIPAAVGLFALAQPVLTTLFQYGQFSAEDTRMATYSLMAYSAGLPAFIFIKLLSTGFFARQDTKTPVKIGVVAMLSNMVYNVLWVAPMLYFDVIAPHTGLALATMMSAWQQAITLYRRLIQEDHYQPNPGWGREIARVLAAVACMGLLIAWLSPSSAVWTEYVFWQRAGALLGIIAAALVAYVGTLLLLGARVRDYKVAQ